MSDITKVSVDVLKVHPRNQEFFDDISGSDYEQFKTSIKEDGIISEIIVAPDMTILSGHQRFKAAKELGFTTVPIRIREDIITEDQKLKILLSANFGRQENSKSKKRKIADEYVALCGYKNGEMGRGREKECQNGIPKLTLDEIAKQLGTTKRSLQRSLKIERDLTEDMKQLLDDGVISETFAADVIASMSEEEQLKFISELDITKKYTAKELQPYVDQIKELKENPTVPSDYETIKEQVETYKKDFLIMEADKERYATEITELKNRIAELETRDDIAELQKKLETEAGYFTIRTYDYIQKNGGFIWITERMDKLPSQQRKEFISTIYAIDAFAKQMVQNIGGYGIE